MKKASIPEALRKELAFLPCGRVEEVGKPNPPEKGCVRATRVRIPPRPIILTIIGSYSTQEQVERT